MSMMKDFTCSSELGGLRMWGTGMMQLQKHHQKRLKHDDASINSATILEG